MSYMIFFDAKEDTLNFFVKGMGSKRGVLGGHQGFLTGYLEGRVILDVIYDFI